MERRTDTPGVRLECRVLRSRADLGCSSICSIERCPYGGGRLNPPSHTKKKVWGKGRTRGVRNTKEVVFSDLLFLSAPQTVHLFVDSPRCCLRIVADDVSVSTSIEHGVIGPEARGNFLWNFQKANPGWRCVPTTRENEEWCMRRKKSEGRAPSWVSDKLLFERVVGPPFRRCKGERS